MRVTREECMAKLRKRMKLVDKGKRTYMSFFNKNEMEPERRKAKVITK